MPLKIPALFLASLSSLFAAPDTVDATFASSAGQVFDSSEFGGIASSIVQSDGKVIFGSNEMPGMVGGSPLQIPLIRFNPDGSVDSTYGADNQATGGGTGIVFFNPGWPEVHDMALQADGKLIAAGVMQGYSADGSTITHGGMSIVRFNVDGTPDPTFTTRGTTQAGGLNYINDVEVQSDGKILAAGGFGGVQNSDSTFFSRKGLVRFNTDGSVDPTFNLNPSDFDAPGFADGFVRAIEVTAGGDIYASVDFYRFGTDYFSGLCRLRPDGSRDFSYAPSYSGDFIQGLNLDVAGRILVVGRDETATTPHVERFLSTGAKDPSFSLDPSLGLVASEQVEESASGQYYFTINGGKNAIRINGDGSLDSTFNATSDHPDAPAGPGDGFIRAFALSPDGSIYAGSFFSSINAISTKKIVKFEGDLAPATINFSTTSISVIESDQILTLSAVRTGDLSSSATATVLVTGGTADAGDFTSATPYALSWPAGVGGAQLFSITVRDDAVEDGNKTVNFSLPNAAGANVGPRDSLTVTLVDDEAPAGIAIPPGNLTAVSGADAIFTVTITSATPATYQWQRDGVDLPGAITPTLTLPGVDPSFDGASIRVVVTNSGGSTTSAAATLSVTTPDGSRNFSFPGDLSGLAAVSKMARLPDGSIVLAPVATAFRAPVRLSRIRPDGSLDPNFGPDFINLTSNSQISDIEVTSTGKIIVYGTFNSVGGVARTNLVRLNPDGVIDTFFKTNTTPSSKPFLDFADRLYASFGFSQGLVRLLDDGSIDPNFTSNAGRNVSGGGTIYAMAQDSAGRIYAADFVNTNPQGFPVRIQRLLADGSTDPSFIAPPVAALRTMIVLSDGRLALGLNNDLIILKENGRRDSTFQSASGTVGLVDFLLEDRGGIIASGGFPLTRFLASGKIDDSFPPASGGAVNDAFRLTSDALLLAPATGTFNEGAVPPAFSIFARQPTLDFVAGGITVAENDSSFDVTIRAFGNVTSTITADLVSVDDTAVAGTHFNAISETLSFDSANLEQTVTVTLIDDGSSNDTREFTLTLNDSVFQIQILDDESAPIITTQPTGSVVLPGQSVTLTVGLIDDSGATAQWFLNGRVINDATSLTHQPTIGGAYSVEVTRNGISVLSELATVEFTPDSSAIRSGFGFGSPLVQNPVQVIKSGPLGEGYLGTQGGPNGKALWKMNPDNTPDPAWSPTIFGVVEDLVVESDGAAVIVGTLDIRGDSPVVTQIARYLPDGSRDLAFQSNIGTASNGTIEMISRYPNGDLLIGGSFTEWNGTALTTGSSLVKLDAQGNLIPSFSSPRNDTVIAAVPLPNGGALVIFQQLGTRILTLDATGTSESTKFLGKTLTDLTPSGDGKWFVFSSQNFSSGGMTGNLARLDSNLNIEQVFPITKAETAHTQANGKVVIGGSFIKNGHRKIIRLLPDGSTDPSFTTANGVRTFNENDGKVIRSLAIRPDGGIWAGGSFDGFGANNVVNFPNLVLINGDPVEINIVSQPTGRFVENDENVVLTVEAVSELDITYQWQLDGNPLVDGPGVSGSQTTELTLTAPATTGNYQLIMTGGPITTQTIPAFIGVLGVPDILRLSDDLNTASDLPVLLQVEAFGSGTLTYQWLKNGSPITGQTSSLLNLPASKVSDSGSYTVSISNNLGTITSDPIEVTILQNGASVVEGFEGPSVNNTINALLILPDDKVLVGGDFFNFNSADFSVQGGRRLAVMSKDGTVTPGPGPAPDNSVQALAMQPDGKIIVAGRFAQIGGAARKQIARLNADLTLDPSFDPGDVFPGFATIYNVSVDRDGKILVVHTDRNLNYLTRLLPDGSNDPSFLAAPSSIVRKIIPQDDGSYLVAGTFTNWDGVSPTSDSGLVQIANDGSLMMPDFTTSQTRFNDLFQFSNGDLLALYQNLSLEILSSDGLPVTDRFDGFSANSSISAFAESPEGLIYLGGAFTQINGEITNRMLRTTTEGTPDPSFNVGTGFNDQVTAMALNGDGSIWVAGRFTQYNGNPVNRITLLTGTMEPPTGRTFQDFIGSTNLPVNLAGFAEDPDGDGYANGLEFLLNGDPETAEFDLISGSSLKAASDLGLADGNDYLTLEISIAEDLIDLPWSIQASTNLSFAAGDLENAVQVGNPIINNGMATYLFRCPWPVQDPKGQGFLRLELSDQ